MDLKATLNQLSAKVTSEVKKLGNKIEGVEIKVFFNEGYIHVYKNNRGGIVLRKYIVKKI